MGSPLRIFRGTFADAASYGSGYGDGYGDGYGRGENNGLEVV